MAIYSDGGSWGNPQDPYNTLNGGMGGVGELMGAAYAAQQQTQTQPIVNALNGTGYQSAPTGGGGGGGGGYRGGGGYGGGGGGGRRVTGLEFYRAGRFKPGNLMAQARKEMNARLLEQKRGSNVARGQANLANRNQMRELGNVRMQGLSQAAAQQGQEYGRLNNISMNRGMGYGEGAGANYGNLANQFSERRGGVESQYGQSTASAYDALSQTLAGYDEADRAFKASLPSLTQELYRNLYNEAYQQWYNQQQLALEAVQQRNQARVQMAG